MASTEVSIKELPTVSSIEKGNFIVVQTDNATHKLDFKDFVVALDNTTFKNTINQNTTDILALSSTFFENAATAMSSSYTTTAIHGIPIKIKGVSYNIMLSATAHA